MDVLWAAQLHTKCRQHWLFNSNDFRNKNLFRFTPFQVIPRSVVAELVRIYVSKNFQSLINAWICLLCIVSAFPMNKSYALEASFVESHWFAYPPTHPAKPPRVSSGAFQLFMFTFSRSPPPTWFSSRRCPWNAGSNRCSGARFSIATFPFSIIPWLAVKMWKCFSEKLSMEKEKIN